MPVTLHTAAKDFEARLAALLGDKRETAADVDDAVAAIIADVRARGDAAVLELTAKFDRLSLTAQTMRVSTAEIDAAMEAAPEAEMRALELAAARIEAYHARQIPHDERWTDPSGAELGWRWTAVDAAGLYVPGGTASYPSSVLMNAIPARTAGVKRLVMCVPTPDGKVNPLVLAAARLAGIEEIYRIGGAQAIAAMAHGTATIRPVDKITGPGNAFVAAAKRRVFGYVGIDMIAGPSEILVIADKNQNPDWIALDLLSQAEHDVSAQSILITDDAAFGDAVAAAVAKRLETLERRAIAGKSWEDHGAIIIVRDLAEAARISNRFAPEHLELCVADPEALSAEIRHAGAIFLGAYTPEAIGDYVGGPNHVLPTARSARFSSGLSVLDFMKRTTIAKMTPGSLAQIGPSAVALAKSESLEAHGLSVTARLDALNERPTRLDALNEGIPE
jgi:histidinol dehydrogenase